MLALMPSSPHSAVVKHLRHVSEHEKFTAALEQVSNKWDNCILLRADWHIRTSVDGQPAQFALKKSYEPDFNRFFYHYESAMKSRAEEVFLESCKSKTQCAS